LGYTGRATDLRSVENDRNGAMQALKRFPRGWMTAQTSTIGGVAYLLSRRFCQRFAAQPQGADPTVERRPDRRRRRHGLTSASGTRNPHLGDRPRSSSKSFPRLPSGLKCDICVTMTDCLSIYYQIAPKMLVSAAWDFQVAGHEPSVPPALDLTDFSRQRARLLLEFEF
jgi:hypothetical protein